MDLCGDLLLTATLAISVNIYRSMPSFGQAVHHAAFTVSSIITTTGYGTLDFNLWPEFSRVILCFLMIVGACAGSTGGGFKSPECHPVQVRKTNWSG